jgi:hypothetical protein
MHSAWVMPLVFVSLTACDGGVPARLEAEQAAAEARHAAERAEVEPVRDAVLEFLTHELHLPAETRTRLHANLNERCSIVVDPLDPAGCATSNPNVPYAGCRSMLLAKRGGAWALVGGANGVQYTLPDACPIGLLAAWEYRELGSLDRVGWTGGM